MTRPAIGRTGRLRTLAVLAALSTSVLAGALPASAVSTNSPPGQDKQADSTVEDDSTTSQSDRGGKTSTGWVWR